MKVVVDKKKLMENLQMMNAFSVLNNKINIPVIRNILIVSEKGMLMFKVISNNVCRCISKIEEVETLEEGKILINPKILLDIIEKGNDNKIKIEKIDDSVLRISYEGYETNLNILDHEQFPDFDINFNDSQKPIILSKNDINFINKKIIFPSANDSNFQQQIYNSVQIDAQSFENIIMFTHTNSIQLANWKKNYSGQAFKFCIQKDIFKNIDFLTRDEEISLFYFEDNIYIKNKTTAMEIKNWEDVLGVSKFGDVSKILREDSLSKIKINRRNLINSLEKSIIFKGGNSKIVKMKINKFELTIKSNSDEIGSSKEVLKIKTENVENGFDINVDANYLLSVIKILDSEEIEIGFGGLIGDVKFEPIVIKDYSIKNYIQIVALSIA